ncbi:MAG: DUF47 family protein [Clostridia bacterium]|nr:DUF47 family protein [Clostridia bacterium]
MAKQRSNEYFEGFVRQMQYACDMAAFLKQMSENYVPAELESKLVELHKIEHAADLGKHALIEKLTKEFITPIEREDIMVLFQQIDDVTDHLEDIALRLYMYNVRELRAEMKPFVDVILQCCLTTRDALAEFPDFKKSPTLKSLIIQVNTLEEQGDRLQRDAMRRLYAEEATMLERITWTKMFDWLEGCCDACEDVTDTIEMVLLKNS